MIVVGDRESDIYELFRRQHEQGQEAGLLVRAHRGWQRRVKVWSLDLRALMMRYLEARPDHFKPVLEGRKVKIKSQGANRARKRRTALTEVRIGAVQLLPPQDQAEAGTVEAWVVQVRETSTPPAGQPLLEWLLVSREGGPTAAWAERIVS